MCIKCLIMQLRCIFFALCRRDAARRCADGGEGQQRLRRCAAQRVEEGKRPPGGAGNGLYPDISQQSFHNSSIFAGRSLTKLVSFRETFQDEIAN